nr:hypothetical protein [Tanacetum cinerariifolium]
QAGPNLDDQDEGQAGPNPDEQAKGQARSPPSDVAASQPLPSLVVHARPNIEHMEFKVADVLTQPHPEQMDKGFTATAYPKPICSLRSVDESVAEGILEKKPRVNDEEADVQRALEESLKSIYNVPWCPLPLVGIRELESGKY